MLDRLKISQKIFVLGAIQLTLVLVVGAVGMLQMQKIGDELFDITEEDIPLTNALTKVTEHQLEQAILFERALVHGLFINVSDEGSQDHKHAKQRYNHTKTEFMELNEKVNHEFKAIESFIENAIPLLHAQEAKDEYKALLVSINNIDEEHHRYAKEVESVFKEIEDGKVLSLMDKIEGVEKFEDQLDHDLIIALTGVQKFTLKSARQAKHDEEVGLNIIASVLALSIIASLIFPFVIGKKVTAPINAMKMRLQEIAEGDGDLRTELDESGRDETAEAATAFNIFLRKLRNVLTKVNESSDVLCENSEMTLEVIQETQEGVNKQRGETDAVATAVTEMSASTQEVAHNTNDASEFAGKVKSYVHEGLSFASENKKVMEKLSSEVGQANEVVQTVASEINNIGAVLDSILSIADQTNLLALNAAIESARAGESGRGFAVVADEVRALAQRTQSSTAETRTLLERLQAQAGTGVTYMSNGEDSAKLCLDKANETANALKVSADTVNSISDLNEQIATASMAQSHVADEVDKNLNAIKDIAENNANDVVRVKHAGEEMAKSIVSLNTQLNQFKL